MFTCLPHCQISELGLLDWGLLIAFGISVFMLSTLWRRWAFSRESHTPEHLRWHLPRFIYVLFVTAMLTLLPIATFLGSDSGYWYGKFFLLPTAAVAYFAWLIVDINDPDKQ